VALYAAETAVLGATARCECCGGFSDASRLPLDQSARLRDQLSAYYVITGLANRALFQTTDRFGRSGTGAGAHKKAVMVRSTSTGSRYQRPSAAPPATKLSSRLRTAILHPPFCRRGQFARLGAATAGDPSRDQVEERPGNVGAGNGAGSASERPSTRGSELRVSARVGSRCPKTTVDDGDTSSGSRGRGPQGERRAASATSSMQQKLSEKIARHARHSRNS